jgi:hypothetical protein
VAGEGASAHRAKEGTGESHVGAPPRGCCAVCVAACADADGGSSLGSSIGDGGGCAAPAVSADIGEARGGAWRAEMRTGDGHGCAVPNGCCLCRVVEPVCCCAVCSERRRNGYCDSYGGGCGDGGHGCRCSREGERGEDTSSRNAGALRVIASLTKKEYRRRCLSTSGVLSQRAARLV